MNMFERLDAAARWLLIGLAGLIPFFFIPVPWIAPLQGKIGLVALLLIINALLWFAARILEGGVRVPWSIVPAAATTLPLVYAISVAVSGVSHVSIFGTGIEADTLVLVCIEFAALVLTMTIFAGHTHRIRNAVSAFLFGGAVLVVLEALHFAVPSLTLGGVLVGQTGNAFGSWHELAMMAGLILFLCISLISSKAVRGYWKYAVGALAVLAILLLAVDDFFDVWATVGAAVLVYILVRGYRARGLSSSAFWGREWPAVSVVALSLFFVVFGTFVTNVLPASVRVAQLEVRPSWQGTLSVGAQSLSKPLSLIFGTGPNTFTREWGLYKPLNVNQTQFWNTSFSTGVASVPTSFITVGLLGVLAWIAFMLATLWMTLRFWFSPIESPVTPLAIPLSVAVLYLMAYHIFSVPGTAFTVILFMFLGFLLAALAPTYVPLRYIPLSGRGWESYGNLAGALALIVVIIAASASSLRVVAAETLINRSIVSYNASQNVETSSRYIADAIRIYPSDRAHRAAVELGLIELQQLAATADPNKEEVRKQLEETLKETIQHGLEAVSINGNDYQNWLELASLYSQFAGSNIEGAYENARAAFAKANEANPTSPIPYLDMAKLEMLKNNPTAALQYLAQAVQLKQDLAVAYYLASQVYASQNDMKNALQAAASAAQYAQNDSQAWYNLGIIAYSADDNATASAALERALILQPQFANAMYVLGLSYYKQGRADDALKQFEALNALDPGQDVVEKMISDIKAGRPLEQAQSQSETPARK